MKGFKEFTTGKGYVSLSIAEEDEKRIFSILKKLNIDNYIKDLHLTLMYDRSNPSVSYTTQDTTYDAKIVDVKLLGEPGTKWYSIALDLDSDELHSRHKDLKELGYKHSYPNYIPHLSLKYLPSDSDINLIKDNIDLFRKLGNIKFHNEKLCKIIE